MLRISLTLVVLQTDSVFFCLHIEASLADGNPRQPTVPGVTPQPRMVSNLFATFNRLLPSSVLN